ncbi:hypothetical protein DMB37_28590 [Nocardia sp. CS682]|nr:hypothetical protein DMB37_28590 [Nocardia sp. CS682]
MSSTKLKEIDKWIRFLPVTFDSPKDPISQARQQVLGTKEFTDESRLKLCNPDHHDVNAYYKVLTKLIEDGQTSLAPDLRGLSAEKEKATIKDYWTARYNGLSRALGDWLPTGP